MGIPPPSDPSRPGAGPAPVSVGRIVRRLSALSPRTASLLGSRARSPGRRRAAGIPRGRDHIRTRTNGHRPRTTVTCRPRIGCVPPAAGPDLTVGRSAGDRSRSWRIRLVGFRLEPARGFGPTGSGPTARPRPRARPPGLDRFRRRWLDRSGPERLGDECSSAAHPYLGGRARRDHRVEHRCGRPGCGIGDRRACGGRVRFGGICFRGGRLRVGGSRHSGHRFRRLRRLWRLRQRRRLRQLGGSHDDRRRGDPATLQPVPRGNDARRARVGGTRPSVRRPPACCAPMSVAPPRGVPGSAPETPAVASGSRPADAQPTTPASAPAPAGRPSESGSTSAGVIAPHLAQAFEAFIAAGAPASGAAGASGASGGGGGSSAATGGGGGAGSVVRRSPAGLFSRGQSAGAGVGGAVGLPAGVTGVIRRSQVVPSTGTQMMPRPPDRPCVSL